MSHKNPTNQIYFRVKRHKTTIFLQAKITDKILTLKKNIIKILGDSEKRDPKKLQLLISTDDSESPVSYSILDKDEDTVNQLGLKDDQILFLCFWDDNLDQWENVAVEYPDPYDEVVEEDEPMEEDDDINEKNDLETISLEDGKGKARA
ncbi:692_t:CDS:2 [Funneliformis geosporum]|uniref:10994_t:CDS:1 n=1 Tax=Funneliformis geosporum TaxID=1117311 RepID=A0A9W4SNI2_9GLOM|nr:10994_t:CDS:2 [Funneliformis geosporum]CAI2177813.1 692_t:CDS:2 [Funneliformis geosporum]